MGYWENKKNRRLTEDWEWPDDEEDDDYDEDENMIAAAYMIFGG